MMIAKNTIQDTYVRVWPEKVVNKGNKNDDVCGYVRACEYVTTLMMTMMISMKRIQDTYVRVWPEKVVNKGRSGDVVN